MPSAAEPGSLQAILDAREWRAERQRALLASFGAPLLSFTLNLPGPDKTAERYLRVHQRGLRCLCQQLRQTGWRWLHIETAVTAAGPSAMLLLPVPAVALKRCCLQFERAQPLGRLFDLDVLAADGQAIGREQLGQPPRRCLLCDQPAHACARGRRHSLSELLTVIERMIATDCPPVEQSAGDAPFPV